MPKYIWMQNPRGRGQKIPPALQEETRRRILKHAQEIAPNKASTVVVRFRGSYCYIDAREPDSPELMPLCRLNYQGSVAGWSLAFYKYSDEKYELSTFATGSFYGTPEDGLEIAALYLT